MSASPLAVSYTHLLGGFALSLGAFHRGLDGGHFCRFFGVDRNRCNFCCGSGDGCFTFGRCGSRRFRRLLGGLGGSGLGQFFGLFRFLAFFAQLRCV